MSRQDGLRDEIAAALAEQHLGLEWIDLEDDEHEEYHVIADAVLSVVQRHIDAAREQVAIPTEGLVLIGEWVCEKADGCTCYGPGPGQPHEPHCGFEPIVKVNTKDHDAAHAADRDAAVARAEQAEQAVARVRELHKAKIRDLVCGHCAAYYPCDTIRALDGTP